MIEIYIILWLLSGLWAWTHTYRYIGKNFSDKVEVFYSLVVITCAGPTSFFLNFLLGVYDKEYNKDKKTE